MIKPFGQNKFARAERSDLRGQLACARRRSFKGSVRHICPGEAVITCGRAGNSENKIRPACIEQRILRQGSGGDEAHDLAADDRFRAAFFRLGRIFRLLADGDAETFFNETLKINFGGMHRHPAHGNGLT